MINLPPLYTFQNEQYFRIQVTKSAPKKKKNKKSKSQTLETKNSGVE